MLTSYPFLQRLAISLKEKTSLPIQRDLYYLLLYNLYQLLRKNPTSFSRDDILIPQKILRNQTKTSKKEYHFGTTGNIYNFGYGPVYTFNAETQYTIDQFAKSEFPC